MREKIIELLMQKGFGVEGATIAADHLIANGVTIQKWIPVTERLPKVRQRILVYCESKTIEKHITACTYMGGLYGKPEFSRHCHKVTHWMPLPEPPKE